MEPITFTAIVAFLGYQAAGGVVSEVVSDAYQALREKLVSRFGNETDVLETVEVLEKKPDSEGARLMFQEEVERAAVDQDPEIRKAARHLQDQLESQPGGEQHIQQARGSYIAQADHGSIASVNIEHSKRVPEE